MLLMNMVLRSGREAFTARGHMRTVERGGLHSQGRVRTVGKGLLL